MSADRMFEEFLRMTSEAAGLIDQTDSVDRLPSADGGPSLEIDPNEKSHRIIEDVQDTIFNSRQTFDTLNSINRFSDNDYRVLQYVNIVVKDRPFSYTFRSAPLDWFKSKTTDVRHLRKTVTELVARYFGSHDSTVIAKAYAAFASLRNELLTNPGGIANAFGYHDLKPNSIRIDAIVFMAKAIRDGIFNQVGKSSTSDLELFPQSLRTLIADSCAPLRGHSGTINTLPQYYVTGGVLNENTHKSFHLSIRNTYAPLSGVVIEHHSSHYDAFLGSESSFIGNGQGKWLTLMFSSAAMDNMVKEHTSDATRAGFAPGEMSLRTWLNDWFSGQSGSCWDNMTTPTPMMIDVYSASGASTNYIAYACNTIVYDVPAGAIGNPTVGPFAVQTIRLWVYEVPMEDSLPKAPVPSALAIGGNPWFKITVDNRPVVIPLIMDARVASLIPVMHTVFAKINAVSSNTSRLNMTSRSNGLECVSHMSDLINWIESRIQSISQYTWLFRDSASESDLTIARGLHTRYFQRDVTSPMVEFFKSEEFCAGQGKASEGFVRDGATVVLYLYSLMNTVIILAWYLVATRRRASLCPTGRIDDNDNTGVMNVAAMLSMAYTNILSDRATRNVRYQVGVNTSEDDCVNMVVEMRKYIPRIRRLINVCKSTCGTERGV